MPAAPHPNQYEQRKTRTNERLHAALARLLAGTPQNPALQTQRWKLNVTTLAIEAGISRNTIYQNHPDVLEALQNARTARNPKGAAGGPSNELRALKRALRQAERDQDDLITENAKLLARALDAERELAELRIHHRRLDTQPADI